MRTRRRRRCPHATQPSVSSSAVSGRSSSSTAVMGQARVCASAVASPGTRSCRPEELLGLGPQPGHAVPRAAAVDADHDPDLLPLRVRRHQRRRPRRGSLGQLDLDGGRQERADQADRAAEDRRRATRSRRGRPAGRRRRRRSSCSIAVSAPGAPVGSRAQPESAARSGSAAASTSVSDQREQPRRLVPAAFADVVLELDQGGDQRLAAVLLAPAAGGLDASHQQRRQSASTGPGVSERLERPDGVGAGWRPGPARIDVRTPARSPQFGAGTRNMVAPAFSAPAIFSWMPPMAADVAVGVDRAGAGDVPPGQQRARGDLVVDGQGEDQAGARAADLLAEVEGDLRRVASSRCPA